MMRVGLCAACTNARTVVSGRGSVFWMCELAATDPSFRKYPPLPVVECTGFDAKPEKPVSSPQ